MAWHIPQELMNNNPLPIEEVEKRYEAQGLKLLDKNYKNNLTKLCCEDSEGYRVMVALESLGTVKQYKRFSTMSNLENYMYNIELFRKKNNIPSKVLSWEPTKRNGHIKVRCLCECGNEFVTEFNSWHRMTKVRCNDCVRAISNLEYTVRTWLKDNSVEYIEQYRFDDCRDKRPLPFDFYLPQLNICIEVDGEQHFRLESMKHFRGVDVDEEYMKNRERVDNIKTQYCLDNNIKLIRLKYDIVRNGKFKEILQREIYTD